MPDLPGEKLIIKLWESLADKGIGGLLRPWQIGREGRAQIRNRALEVVALAQAEQTAQEIRAGRLTWIDERLQIPLASSVSQSRLPAASPHGTVAALEYSVSAAAADAVRVETNVAKAISLAEAELAERTDQASPHPVDTDWLYRWRDAAGSVSSDKLQQLWAKILAGEVVQPGSYSLRTLDLLRNFSKADAELTSRAFRYVYNTNSIAKSPVITAEGLSFDDLLELEAIGVVGGVQGFISQTFKSTASEKFVALVVCGQDGLVIRADDPAKTFTVDNYVLTPSGRELFKLGDFGTSEAYLDWWCQTVKAAGFNVAAAHFRLLDDGRVNWDTDSETPL